jgi:hypothetical protein
MSTRRALLGLIAAALLLWSGATALAAEKGQVDPNAPVFIKLQPLNVTVFDRGLTRGKITIELQLDVIKKASAANVQSRLPRLYDGFLAAVTEYSNSRTAVDRAPDLDYLLERFQTITDEAVGAGTAKVPCGLCKGLALLRRRGVRPAIQPTVEEAVQPAADERIVQWRRRQLCVARLRLRAQQVRVVFDPARDDARRYLRMKLHPDGVAVAKGLVREHVPLRQQLGTVRQLEALVVPLVDVHLGGKQAAAGGGSANRLVADLVQAMCVARDAGSERTRQQLRAEANAEVRRASGEYPWNPRELGADEVQMLVVGAHATAHEDDARKFARTGQCLAGERTTRDRRHAARMQGVADLAGRSSRLVGQEKNLGAHGVPL